MNKERDIYLWLSHITSFRSKDIPKLRLLFPDINELMDSLMDKDIMESLTKTGILKKETQIEIENLDFDTCISNAKREMKFNNISYTCLYDSDYPRRLINLPDPPLCLYYKGDLSLSQEDHTIAIIGSRRPTHYGLSVADEFSKSLSAKGMVIISGMAYGIDSRAHQAALDTGGKTIAVLGGGVDICYPRTSISLYSSLCQKGLIISEYPPHTQHLPVHFPRRNRIISGLSDGLVVVEAAMKSGTLITTDFALDQGKSIYAIPGRISDMMSKGVNNLIKQGASLVDSPSDVITDIMGIPLKRKASVKSISTNNKYSQSQTNVNPTEKKIIEMLGYEPLYIDDIIRANGMNISETIHILHSLEDKGLIESIEQSYYVLKH
ncbi:MAG: DNA-processing protein DprA [Eubacterium sp.]|nr:DNA-processing protein DprA [Eubacterium sp.]